MKTLFFLLCSIIWIPCVALAIEPVGTIGQPFPEKHAFLSDGTILRVGWTHLQIVHPVTGAVIDEFAEQSDISEVVLSPSAEHLAILSPGVEPKTTRVTVWDVKLRQQISEWEVPAYLGAGAFSPKGTLFAIGFDDKIHLWNWQTGEWLGTMTGERRPSKQCHSHASGGATCAEHTLVFTPNADYLIVTSARLDVELWNVETRRLEAHFESHVGSWVEGATVSPNGEFLATTGAESGSIYLWSLETQELLWDRESGIGNVSGAVFSPGSQRLYVATETDALYSSGGETWKGWDDQVRVWDVASGQQLDTFGTEFRKLGAFALSPNGKTALLHYRDAIVLWDIEARQQLRVWADFEGSFYPPVLSPDGQTLVSVSPYFIKVWHLASQQLRQLISAEGGTFRMFAISPDGQKLAVGRDPWIQVYNLQTGAIEMQFPYTRGHSDIAFSSTGGWVAARGYGEIFLFDVENPEKSRRAVPADRGISTWFDGLAFSENDAYLAATGDEERQVLLWKREGDTFVFHYAWDVPELWTNGWERYAFGKVDGSTVLAVPGREHLQIWRLGQQHPELIATLLDADSPAHFSPDGRYLFADQNDSLQIWEWQTNTPLVHPPIPRYFAVSQDGSVVLSYHETGQILIWDGRQLLPSGAVAVEPRGKRIVTLGQMKQNQLLQNFPNPFNPETWIPFRLANESPVTVRIYAATGQLIRVLSPGILPSGDYASPAQEVYWDGRNEVGEPVSSGVYLYTLHAGDFSATRKMLIRK